MFIKDNSAWINVETACNTFGFSKSAYYEWLTRLESMAIKNEQAKTLAARVITEFNKSRRTYGAARLLQKLDKQGVNCTYKQVLNIMKFNDLIPVTCSKYKVTTTNSSHKYKVFDNLLERNFNVTKPNQAWVSDITYIHTGEGWLYLATVIDLFSRKPIGYHMDNRMTKNLVITALNKALKARGYPKNVVVHSDRGSQYASNDYKSLLAIHSLRGSMSKKGDCWDNAVAESFFATIKKEYIHQSIFRTRNEAKLGIFDYIEAWYNSERIHSYLGNMSPNEFEHIYFNNEQLINDKIAKFENFKLSYPASGF